MNPTAPETPNTAPQTSEPTAAVAVKITVRPPVPCLFPDDNSIGTYLLAALFTRELRGQNLLAKAADLCVGKFNDSVYVFPVARLAPALAIIEEILKIPTLREVATVLVYLPKLDVFQPYGPDHAGISRGLTMNRISEISHKWEADKLAALETSKRISEALKEYYHWRELGNKLRSLPPLEEPPTPPANPDQTK